MRLGAARAACKVKPRQKRALAAFMRDWYAESHPNPISPDERLIGFEGSGWVIVDLKPLCDSVHLSWMQVLPGDARKGAATAALSVITSLADKHKVSVDLRAKPTGKPRISKTQLKRFYKKFGFEATRGDYMLRKPARNRSS